MVAVATLAMLAGGGRLAADQLVLKDGKKLTGTIVGFEHGMFRVKTGFGFELVRRDRVGSIEISGGKLSKADTLEVPESGSGEAAGEIQVEKPADTELTGAKSAAAPASKRQPSKPSPPRVLNEPLPREIRQHVEGASYINDTFQFAMFKPLEWRLLEDIRQETTTGIVAMGSDDEHTLLIVDRQVWSGHPSLASDRIVVKLRNTYQEYRKLSEERIEIGGLPATQSAFSGVVDGVEWHGITVHVEKGDVVYGIIGLTSGENYQFQEAVFRKIAQSFHFIDQNRAASQ